MRASPPCGGPAGVRMVVVLPRRRRAHEGEDLAAHHVERRAARISSPKRHAGPTASTARAGGDPGAFIGRSRGRRDLDRHPGAGTSVQTARGAPPRGTPAGRGRCARLDVARGELRLRAHADHRRLEALAGKASALDQPAGASAGAATSRVGEVEGRLELAQIHQLDQRRAGRPAARRPPRTSSAAASLGLHPHSPRLDARPRPVASNASTLPRRHPPAPVAACACAAAARHACIVNAHSLDVRRPRSTWRVRRVRRARRHRSTVAVGMGLPGAGAGAAPLSASRRALDRRTADASRATLDRR